MGEKQNSALMHMFVVDDLLLMEALLHGATSG